jgi:diguanylate cyclase (GGDEF)-like protein
MDTYADQRWNSRQMELALGILFLAGATLALVTLALPHWTGGNDSAIAITASSGYPVAGVLLRSNGRMPLWAIHVLLAAGTLFVTAGVYLGNAHEGSLTTAILYVWVALYAFHFFPWRVAALHLAWVGAAYAAILAYQDYAAGPGQWLFVLGTAGIAGAVVGSLSGQVRHSARTDALTGLANRRAWEEIIIREVSRAQRAQRPLCVALLDLDDFKALNDQQGHLAGDRFLQRAATSWRREIRGGDVLTRFGGDEFAVLLPDTDPTRACEALERLRAATPDDARFSAGLARWQAGDEGDTLVARADAALYEAKRQGGGRTIVAEATAA